MTIATETKPAVIFSVDSYSLKPAAIWARVSTKGQKEISPDTQILQCQTLLKSKGYIAIKIFSIDFCSLDLSISREFQELQRMILNHEIDAVACYDRDRLMADGVDRLLFLSQLKEADVELLICNGAPIMDTDEGQIVELALALGKKRSVLRARSGAHDGLHDRVTLKKKPANHRKIHGYDWNIPNETLIPNADYPTVELIFNLAMAGNGYAKIKKELEKQGIASPHGRIWGKGNLSKMIHNPVYAGRFYGLKTRTVRGEQPGARLELLPESEWTFIPEVKIEKHPITWEQRTQLFEQIQKHIALSSRHANRQYLCRGMIECEEHLTDKGKHKVFHGRPWHDSFGYICPGKNKPHHFIPGEKLETTVKSALKYLFSIADSELWQHVAGIEKINRPELETILSKQQTKLSQNFKKEAMLADDKYNGKISQDAFDLLHGKYNTERKGIESGILETQQQIESTDRIEEKIEGLKEIRSRFLKNTKEFTDKQWRELLEELDCRIRVTPKVPASESDGWILEGKRVEKTLTGIAGYAAFPLPHFGAYMFLKLPARVEAKKIASIGLTTP
jgi:hypothetical protein